MQTKDVSNVCHTCGVTANYLTCLKRYGRPPLQAAFSVSTYHVGTCNVCGHHTEVTQARDFFHPDFHLLFELIKWDHDCAHCLGKNEPCAHEHCTVCIKKNRRS